MQSRSIPSIREFSLFLLYFIVLISLFILTKHTFLGVQDEAQLYGTLKSNEPINYMTSYPFALLGGWLYEHFPSMQWYSILMTFYILILSVFMSWYLAVIEVTSKIGFLFKGLLFILFTLLTTYMLLKVDVTSPTLILVVLAIPLIKHHQAYFWFFVWIAVFLRSQIIISLFPLLLLAYFTMVSTIRPKRKELLLSALFITAAFFTHFSYKLNPSYNDWMTFTEKRAYFTDFGGSPMHNVLTPDEYHLARTWWIVDQDLYPYKKVMADAGSTIDVIKQRFLHVAPPLKYIKFILHTHNSLYFLFLLSLLLAILYKSFLKFAGYFAFGATLILLLIVKDVDRVTMPMLLLWWVMVITDLWYIKKEKYLLLRNTLLLGSILWVNYFLFHDIPWQRVTHFQQREAMAQELRTFLKKNKMQLEITTGFTSSWDHLIETIMQNHLFDENNWIDYHDDLLLQGWFSRVPLVYKQHNVSFNGIKRKYEHYHDWLISPKSGFLGSTGEGRHIRPFLAQNLMRMYDEKFPKQGCKHIVALVDQSKHFVIHKVLQQCKDNNTTLLLDLLDKSPAIGYNNIQLNKKRLIALNNDPQLILNFNKSVPHFVEIKLEIDSPKNTTFQIFYQTSFSRTFTQENSISKNILKGENSISVILPGKLLRYPLRLDIVSKKGTYTIKSLKLYQLNNLK
jgi:hypothetical protein